MKKAWEIEVGTTMIHRPKVFNHIYLLIECVQDRSKFRWSYTAQLAMVLVKDPCRRS